MSIEEYVKDRGFANDPVNHPSHYETGKFECIEVMEEALGRDAVEGFCICNAFKYLYRSQRKNGLEDLEKAKWYLDKLIGMRNEDLNLTTPISPREELDKSLIEAYESLQEAKKAVEKYRKDFE